MTGPIGTISVYSMNTPPKIIATLNETSLKLSQLGREITFHLEDSIGQEATLRLQAMNKQLDVVRRELVTLKNLAYSGTASAAKP